MHPAHAYDHTAILAQGGGVFWVSLIRYSMDTTRIWIGMISRTDDGNIFQIIQRSTVLERRDVMQLILPLVSWAKRRLPVAHQGAV